MAEEVNKGVLMVGQGVIMRGEIKVPSIALIDGTVDGVLEADVVNITENGTMTGTTTASRVRVAGRINQSTTARTELFITKSGSVTGTVAYGELEIEKGGEIEGALSQGAEPPSAPATPHTPSTPAKP
jgi:cytoskeletal protein CcmA (bactofilin family)